MRQRINSFIIIITITIKITRIYEKEREYKTALNKQIKQNKPVYTNKFIISFQKIENRKNGN